MKRLAALLTDHRDKRYKHLLDSMPIFVIPIVVLLFLVVVAGGVVLGALAGPAVYTTQDKVITDPRQIGAFFNGTSYLTMDAYAFGNLNQEVTISLIFKNKLYKSENSLGIAKNDVEMSAILMGKNSKEATFKPVNKVNQTQRKTITCRQRTMYCDPLIIAYLNYIPYNQYQLSVSLLNMQSLYEYGLFDDYVMIEFEYVKNEYSRWEVGWRYTFLFLSVPFCVFYLLYCYCRQQFQFWSSEQKYTSILLIIIILYNNPIFGFHFVVDSWVLPFLDNVFLATFFCFLLLAVLISVHGTIKPIGERGLFFYLPKLILMGLIWVFVLTALTYIRVQEQKDPSYSLSVGRYSSYQLIGIFIMFATGVYCLLLGYYIFRGFEYFRQNPFKFKNRVFIVWFITLLVIVGTIVDVCLYLFKKTWNNSAQFLSYYVLYNAYVAVMGIFYLPSFTRKEEASMEEDRAHIVDEENEIEYME